MSETVGASSAKKADMRVVHVVGAMDRAGTETMIMNLYRAMDRDRIQFDFIVHEDRLCDYDEEIADLGGVIRRIPRFAGANLFEYTRASRAALAGFVDAPVVHGHIGSSAAIYLNEAKKMHKATIAHSHAQNFPLSPEQMAFRAVSFPTRFVADEFLACSRQAGIDRFGAKVAAGDHFHVLPNGIDVGRYHCTNKDHERAKTALGLGGGPIVGHVGRLTEIKNHAFLFEVFAEMLRRAPAAQLVLYGKGELEEQLRSQVEALGLGERVHFRGLTDDVPSALKAMDVMVFPSFKEGLAMALIEAQATGMPCVFSDGVPGEVALSEAAARLPLSDGAAEWAQTALALVEKSRDRSCGSALVRSAGFDVASSAEWLAGFYEKLAEGALCGRIGS